MGRKYIDPDAELSIIGAGESMLDRPDKSPDGPSDSLDDEGGSSRRLTPYQVRQRLTQERKRKPKPDSATGLAIHFLDRCPQRSWTHGLEFANLRSIVAVFSELLRADVTPDTCRAMVDLYFTRLGGRTPNRAYVWDFKFQRYDLLRQLAKTGQTNATPEDYADWNAGTEQTVDYAASWGQV
jgi:hypothetical protein